MATFRFYADSYTREDGLRAVRVRVYHNGASTAMSTPYFVDKTQVTKGGKIKDAAIVDACNELIRNWRNTITNYGSAIEALDVKELVAMLKQSKGDGVGLDIVEHIYKVAESKRAAQTQHNYRVVAASLSRYLDGRGLDINQLSHQVLSAYEEWLRKDGKTPGTIVQYMSLIKSAYNTACLWYNDEDADKIVVTRQPFRRYKMPAVPVVAPRAIDLATLQAIANLPTEPRFNSQRNLGRDLFMLSFGLGGINYADLYALPYDALKGDYIEYKRQKTKHSRADEALYRVYICEEVRPLLTRYLDPTRKRLFIFHRRFPAGNFPTKVSCAVKAVEKAVPFERHYIYYSARHTYATLAYNVAGLDKYTVHELLNHADREMKITDRYIERDWQRLFDVHKRIVALVDWSKICED
ncbi:MAG: site-specific integrase [Alistipes sp.]|nr:site-specific integrase [Alistipes sp.]